ncbi:MAG: hypothetical protein HQK52_23320 [Oligoflexia bacterium]|nr:hypothetical protein [Oligoflexia bacterium]
MNSKIIDKRLQLTDTEKARHDLKGSIGAIELAISVLKDNFENKEFCFELMNEIEKKCLLIQEKIDKIL